MNKISLLKFLLFPLLLALSGCGRASISEDRKNFILAKEHGWIELSVDISPQLINQTTTSCILEASINGEIFLTEPLFPSGAPEKSIKTGFLFAIPSSKSEVVLNYSQCQKVPNQTVASVDIPADTLARLKFDGKTIAASAPESYKPATLGVLAEKLDALATSQSQFQTFISDQLSLMFKVLIAAVVLIVALLIVSLLKHAKKT